MHIAVPDTNPQPPLHITSPIEGRFAVLRAVARDVTANDQARLLQWRQILLSVHFRYILLDTADKIWRAGRQFREDVAQAYVTMRVSVLQNIYEVVHFRRKHDRLHGKTSAKALAAAFREGMTFSEATEPVTDSFVDMAATIDSRMLSSDLIAKCILSAEEQFGMQTPFNGATTLQSIVSKAKTADKILWAVQYILDTWRGGNMAGEALSLRYLQGQQAGGGGKGLIDLLNFKFDLKCHLAEYLTKIPRWDAILVRDRFTLSLRCHDEYRRLNGRPGDEGGMDITWRAGWPKSAELAYTHWESMVYNDTFDNALKVAVRNRKYVEGGLEAPGLVEVFEEVAEMYKEEKNEDDPDDADDGKPMDVDDKAGGKLDCQEHVCELDRAVAEAKCDVLEDDKKQEILKFKTLALKRLQTQVKFVVEPVSEQALANAIAATAAGEVRGDASKGKYVGVVCDVKMAGESTSHPSIRLAPFRQPHHKKLICAVIKSRADGLGDVHPGDVYLVLDGFRHGNKIAFVNSFANDDGKLGVHKRSVMVVHTEESVAQRYKKHANTYVQQDEGILQVSKLPLHLTGRQRWHFAGTNRGTVISNVELTPHSDTLTWKATIKVKREIYGRANRVAVGGAGPDDGKDEEEKGLNVPVPVFYHTPPRLLVEELMWSHDLQAVIDLTPGDGVWAMAAVRGRKPYVGIVFTQKHAHILQDFLCSLIFKATQESEDPLFEPALVAASTKTQTPKAEAKATRPCKRGKEEEAEGEGSSKSKKSKHEGEGGGAGIKGRTTRPELLKKLDALSKKCKTPAKGKKADDDNGQEEDEEVGEEE